MNVSFDTERGNESSRKLSELTPRKAQREEEAETAGQGDRSRGEGGRASGAGSGEGWWEAEVVRVTAKSHLLQLDANSGRQLKFCDESETRRQPGKIFCRRANRGLRIRISWVGLEHSFDALWAESQTT